MTDGYLNAEILSDKLLSKYWAVIIDEAHERNLQIDLILYNLKNILKERKDIK